MTEFIDIEKYIKNSKYSNNKNSKSSKQKWKNLLFRSRIEKLKQEHNELINIYGDIIYNEICKRDIDGLTITLSDCSSLKYSTQSCILKKNTRK